MRPWRRRIPFAKMHSCGNDYIFIENFDGAITCPESLCVSLCAPHFGVGADGIVLIERSAVADAKMRTFNRDGSEGRMAGNNLRCVGKYLYDRGYLRSELLNIETAAGVHSLRLYLRDGKVSSVSVDMGRPDFAAAAVPVAAERLPQRCATQAACGADGSGADGSGADGSGAAGAPDAARGAAARVVNCPAEIGGTVYPITCLSVGNPHCVVFQDTIDGLDLERIGPQFEYAPLFPQRINTEFVRVVDRRTLRLRVWERGSGETLACGTGAVAAVAAAVENGLCDAGVDVTVKLLGGDLTVNCTKERAILTGSAVLVFEGTFEY